MQNPLRWKQRESRAREVRCNKLFTDNLVWAGKGLMYRSLCAESSSRRARTDIGVRESGNNDALWREWTAGGDDDNDK